MCMLFCVIFTMVGTVEELQKKKNIYIKGYMYGHKPSSREISKRLYSLVILTQFFKIHKDKNTMYVYMYMSVKENRVLEKLRQTVKRVQNTIYYTCAIKKERV